MQTETKPLPRLAKSAAMLAQADFQQVINNLGVQTLEVMGLLASDGWYIDFTNGVATREVPDIAPAPKDSDRAPDRPLAATEPKAVAKA